MIGGGERPASGHLARAPATAEDEELRSWIELRLGVAVQELVRHPLSSSSSFACELLTVRAADRVHELFFKDYGRCRLPRENDAGPAREIEVYRHLLDPERLDTARHLGSRRQPEEARTWLLLEHVRGSRLAERSFEHWLAAAGWLGRLQAYSVARGLAREAPAALVVHDARELRATAEDAVRTVAAVDLLLERTLQEALEGYEGIAEELGGEPRTLVHGSFRPENILVDTLRVPRRIAPVDWEHAALGSALHDVAFLSAGLDRSKTERLLAAQRASAAEHGLELPAGERAWELVTFLRLHKLLRSLGRAVRWSYPHETVEHLVTLAGRLSLDLGAARRARALLPCALDEAHPALRAWRTCSDGSRTGGSVERIRGRFFGRKGRVVYRLVNTGPGALPIVAKRCPLATGELERHVYAELLSPLGVSSPRCLGALSDGGSSWLFLEDVGTERLEPEDAGQRALALRWLAGLHATSRHLAPDPRLPDRTSRAFRLLLAKARQRMQAALGNAALSGAERATLGGVLATCEAVASGWPAIDALCAVMPPTLVHGDFRPKNLFLRRSGEGATLLPIDWEYAGRGTPAVDLGAFLREGDTPADRAAYREGLSDRGLSLGEPELRSWLSVGRVLRAVSSIHWASESLVHEYLEKPVGNLSTYGDALGRAFEGLASGTLREAER